MDDFLSEKITDAAQMICEKDYENAKNILNGIIDGNSNLALPHNYLGIIAWEESRWEDSYESFKKALVLDNKNEDALNNLVDAALKLRRIDKIIPIIETAVQENPEESELAEVYKALSNKEIDIYKCDRALFIGRYDPLVEEGDDLVKIGDYMGARKKYLESHDVSGTSAEAYNGLGMVLFSEGEYEEAFLLFSESIKDNPTKTDTFLNLIDSARYCGKDKEALEIYETFAAEYPHLEEIREHIEN